MRFSWAEIVAVLLVAAVVARFYWAAEIRAWEEEVLGGFNYVIAVAFLAFGAYAMLSSEPRPVRRRALRLTGIGLIIVSLAIGVIYVQGTYL